MTLKNTDLFTVLEITGFITGMAGVYLTLRQNSWCFPVGLVNVIISLLLFYRENLYADALQQFVYILLLMYGWYEWIHPQAKEALKVTTLTAKEFTRLGFLTFVCALTLGYSLAYFTNAALPWIDAAATSIAFTAQYLVALKKIENWFLWVIVNAAYIAIYLFKELPLYALLSVVYLVLSFAGYRSWKLHLQTSPEV